MTTGPMHYRAAVMLLRECTNAEGLIYADSYEYLLAAQVHASLALTAATIHAGKVGVTATAPEMAEWDKALTPPKRGQR
ncbi:hypothetical protein [Amycolatopsis sp. H20-H5]|uniref:hypothetical protein n=1 Tax=Amycolatopsis sp. H20-H5 TaxID=3046309 RepID=UPI002DB95AA2|nr:hypothetical protein [Amycolatopsis sp. H20-H5]MEC3974593.1 hypothetical protein [Amycolatopsis sp. H20-H5]